MTKLEQLKSIYDENGLDKEDIFPLKLGGKEIPIITRSGIEKIQAKKKIEVKFEVVKLGDDLKTCVIKAYGSMEVEADEFGPKRTLRTETFGEACTSNSKSPYIVSIAEKRALSRVVLKLSGLYKEGHFGEEEAEEFKKQA